MTRRLTSAEKAALFGRIQVARGVETPPVMTELVLTVPLPPSRNRGRSSHWAVVERQKKAYWAACDTATLGVRFPLWPFERVDATAVAYVRNLNDEDNLKARMKFLQDWCKSRGIVKDDTPACWHWPAPISQFIERTVPAYLVLTLRVRQG